MGYATDLHAAHAERKGTFLEATCKLLRDMQRRGKTMREISDELGIDHDLVEDELYWKVVRK